MPSTIDSAPTIPNGSIACEKSTSDAAVSSNSDPEPSDDESSSGSVMLNSPSPSTVEHLAANFCQLLAQVREMPKPPSPAQSKLLMAWISRGSSDAVSASSPSPSMTTVSCPEYGDLQDKLQRLESDRESLSLQVSILAEQVGAQTDKIRDLESMLEDKKVKLDSTEEMLHEELVTRTSLETNKLDLMGEISNLKLKMAALDRDKYEREQQLKIAQNQIAELQSRRAGLRSAGQDDIHFSPITAAADRTSEVTSLRVAVQKLLSNNAEKECEIEQLRRYIEADPASFAYQYRQNAVLECNAASQGRAVHPNYREECYFQSASDVSPRYKKSSANENQLGAQEDLMTDEYGRVDCNPGMLLNAYGSMDYQRAACLSPYLMGQPCSTNSFNNSPMLSRMRLSPGPGPYGLPSNVGANRNYGFGASRQLAAELDQLALHYRHPTVAVTQGSPYHSGSLPRQISFSPRQNGDYESHSDGPGLRYSSREGEQFKRNGKYSSLRNFVSKIRRSTSEEGRIGSTSFKRPKAAATFPVDQPLNLPLLDMATSRGSFPRPTLSTFCKWNSDQLSEWFCDLGLSTYVSECQQNVKSGRHLINLTDEELEKYLSIKDPLHRKRLRIALKCIEAGKQEPTERMDCSQTSRWLDDIGLPQYKQIFATYRIDGAMLDALTVEDLLHMRINSALHHASLRRGIQVLRMIGFNVGRLHKKFDPLVIGRGSCASAVQWWTQRCVSDWLKTSDLTEFTPNLMGSGVHGSLMILEPTFTAESLACILQIPTQKTLLRRHLSTQFSNLIGADLVAAKRHFISQSDLPVLTPKVKVKLLKRSAFSLARKKSKNELLFDSGDLVCPTIRRSVNASVTMQQLGTKSADQSPRKSIVDSKGTTSGDMLHNLTTTNV